MKRTFLGLILFASLTASATQVTLQAGESVTLSPQQTTTVVCAGPAKTGSGAASSKCGIASEDACRGMGIGDACVRDEKRGSCVARKGILSADCSCLVF